MKGRQQVSDKGEWAAGPNPRDSALIFTEGVRGGWIASDLRVWVDEHLLQPQRLVLRSERIVRLVEPGVGATALPDAATSRARSDSGVQVVSLLAAARERVVQTLRASVESRQSAYIHAALYAGRVSRERGADGRSSWYVFLTDDVALSDQVLALFAADALTHPNLYDTDLCVCDVCGAVSFVSGERSRRGCAIHPFGAYEGTKDSSSQSGSRRAVPRT